MSFNPLQNFNQGFASGQHQRINGLQSALSGQMQDANFTPSNSNDFLALSSLDPERAATMLNTFKALSNERKTAYHEDLQQGLRALESGDGERFKSIMTSRIETMKGLKGADPSGSQFLLDKYEAGDIQGLVTGLKLAEQAGISGGYLQELQNKKDGAKLGTYNPGDYTIDSWAQFAKNGDPSILKRYESNDKTRQIEIRERAQELKEEKFELTKQADEISKNRKELELANKRRDDDRAKFLETEDAKNTVTNISSLLDNDLDLIYGGMEWALPDKLRNQRGKNMLARKNQVVSSLKLMAAGKLKGQGSITENERTMLAQAATTLENQDIDSGSAREELNRILPIYNYFITGEIQAAPALPQSNDLSKLSLDELKALRDKGGK